MATLTMAQAYAYAREAGFDPASAVVAAAIAMGESGLRTDARGDTGLVDAKWGPSVGLMQIRTLKADTGTGKVRDITGLDDPLTNMTAAYQISGQGKDFTPWTVYNTGKYREFIGQASGAAGGYVPGAVSVGGGIEATPVGLPSIGDIPDLIRQRMLIGLGLLGGLALILAGTYRAWAPVARGAAKLGMTAVEVGAAVGTGGTSAAVSGATRAAGAAKAAKAATS